MKNINEFLSKVQENILDYGYVFYIPEIKYTDMNWPENAYDKHRSHYSLRDIVDSERFSPFKSKEEVKAFLSEKNLMHEEKGEILFCVRCQKSIYTFKTN